MAVIGTIEFFKKNSHYVKIVGLKDGDTGVAFSEATVTATLYSKAADGTLTAVTGFQNVTLTLVAGAPVAGTYKGFVPKTFDPAKGSNYVLFIDSDEGQFGGHWELPAVVKVRNK